MPTAAAYFLVASGFCRGGLSLYAAFMFGSYLAGFFRRFAEWPLLSKITLGCGPPVIGLGYLIWTENFANAMLLPGLIYIALGLVGGHLLKQLD
jgi:hypothetical protein